MNLQRLVANRYEIDCLVGRGGMGSVYRARDCKLNRVVAVKCVDSGGDALRSQHEAMLLARVNHPHVLRIYDVILDAQGTWLVSEWIEGTSLSMLEGRKLHPYYVGALMAQIVDALSALHCVGIVHRDLKPSNVMIDRAGNLKLIDFGIAFHPELSSGHTIAGSLRYTDPRILAGEKPDGGSDLYAAGILMLEWLSGSPFWPDLAPLPLFRLVRTGLDARVRGLIAREHPVLGAVAARMIDQVRKGSDRVDAATLATELSAWLHALGYREVQVLVQDALRDGLSRELLGAYDQRLSGEVRDMLAARHAKPKIRAAWLNYAQRLGLSAPRARTRMWRMAAPLFLLFLASVGKWSDADSSLVSSLSPSPVVEFATVTEPLPAANTEPLVIAAPTLVAREPETLVRLATNAWADVFWDDISAGRLPNAKGFRLKPGKHRLRLASPMINPLNVVVDIPRRPTFDLRYKLEPRTRVVELQLRSAGAIRVGERQYECNRTAAVRLPFGEHQISILHDGMITATKVVAVHAGSPAAVALE